MPEARTVSSAYDKLSSALDRFQEAHFWMHQMEGTYHHADYFRWHLNAFLRALKEAPGLIQMALQNEADFVDWFAEQRTVLHEDPLLKALSKQRDLVVHRSMLIPQSTGTVGITEGRGFKAGLTVPIHPLEDSDEALIRVAMSLKDCDFLGLITPDEDSVPCVYREWRIPEFTDELVDLCAKAWLLVGETIHASLKWLGEETPAITLDCRHADKGYRMKRFNRNAVIAKVRERATLGSHLGDASPPAA